MSEISNLLAINIVDLIVLLPVAFVGMLIVLGIRSLMSSQSEVINSRIQRVVFREHAPPKSAQSEVGKAPLLGFFAGIVTKIAKPRGEKETNHLEMRLLQAGLRSPHSMVYYLSVKVILAIAFVAVFLWINSMRSESLPYTAYIVIVCMGIGFYLPGLWLQQRLTNRKKLLNRGLPDALDLLVTCVESGLGLDAAMSKVADETSLSEPLLSNELRQAALEIRAGSSRGDAFRKMASRTGVEEIQNLSAIIVQTEKFGTSIAKALRTMADSMRVRRMQMAEEKAATVSVKMTIPLVFCIFPSLMFIILGPALIKIYHYLSTQGG